MGPGDIIAVETADGQSLEVEVPDGIGPGDVFAVEVETGAWTALCKTHQCHYQRDVIILGRCFCVKHAFGRRLRVRCAEDAEADEANIEADLEAEIAAMEALDLDGGASSGDLDAMFKGDGDGDDIDLEAMYKEALGDEPAATDAQDPTAQAPDESDIAAQTAVTAEAPATVAQAKPAAEAEVEEAQAQAQEVEAEAQEAEAEAKAAASKQKKKEAKAKAKLAAADEDSDSEPERDDDSDLPEIFKKLTDPKKFSGAQKFRYDKKGEGMLSNNHES